MGAILHKPKDPSVHKALTMKEVLLKKLRWITLGGQYDWTHKIYCEGTHPEFPEDIATLINGIFPEVHPQAAIVNLYSPKDTLSMHRDVSEHVDRGLVSISLGCECIFAIGLEEKETGTIQKVGLRLRSGDVLYMTGESRFAWHGVPKIVPSSCPSHLSSFPGAEFPHWESWMRDKRINLNIRQMYET